MARLGSVFVFLLENLLLTHMFGQGFFFNILPPYAEREKNPSEYCALLIADTDSGNQTRATNAASECAIDKSVATRLFVRANIKVAAKVSSKA